MNTRNSKATGNFENIKRANLESHRQSSNGSLRRKVGGSKPSDTKSARRKFNVRSVRPAFEMKFSVRAMVEFVVESLLIFLLASVPKVGGALALGLFSGLVFSKQNLLLLSPIYMVAVIVFALSWWTLLYVAVPVLLLLGLYLVFFKLKRNVPMYSIALTTLISMTPYAVCEGVGGGDIFFIILSLVLSVVFTFCSAIVAYALLYRKMTNKFTLDEQICGGIFLAVASYALSFLAVDGFNIIMTVGGFLLLMSSDCYSPQTSLFSALLIGAGAALGLGDMAYVGDIILLGGVAVALSPFTRFASAAGMLALESILWLLNGFSGSGWKPLVMLLIGISIYLLFPYFLRDKIKEFSVKKSNLALSSIVNRNRGELSSKLFSVSDVFYEMSKNMERTVNVESCFSTSKLASDISKSYCQKCNDHEMCFAQLGGDTACVIEPMAAAVLSRGKVTILDMPPFITSRCSKMNNLISVINSAGAAYEKRKGEASGLETGKRLMSEQFAGVALVLDSMARECGEQVSFSAELTDMLESELLKHNIVAGEIVVTGLRQATQVTLTVRQCDADKAVLPRIVSTKLKTNLEIAEIYPKGEMKVVHLVSSPIFEVAYGIAEKIRSGEGVSGDSKSILSPSRQRRLFAISDGMGSGEAAYRASRDAISMIESFYRAGFDNSIILSLVNKLLKLNSDECFSSLDISVIDTTSGGLDIIKLGSADSFIIHGDSVEAVSSVCPPAGILEDIQPKTSRMQLFDGDLVAMMSDGVFDALDTRGVMEVVAEQDTSNPQTLADALLHRALDNGAEDDCTVIVLRLFCL